jgi:DNA polymerase III delta prime subunit
VLHSEFLTFSCQQMLRRYLEQRSFKCRVWFHVEDPTVIQSAIISRCIVKRMPIYITEPLIK